MTKSRKRNETKRAKFLEAKSLYDAGMPLKDACASQGFSVRTYARMRPDFEVVGKQYLAIQQENMEATMQEIADTQLDIIDELILRAQSLDVTVSDLIRISKKLHDESLKMEVKVNALVPKEVKSSIATASFGKPVLSRKVTVTEETVTFDEENDVDDNIIDIAAE